MDVFLEWVTARNSIRAVLRGRSCPPALRKMACRSMPHVLSNNLFATRTKSISKNVSQKYSSQHYTHLFSHAELQRKQTGSTFWPKVKRVIAICQKRFSILPLVAQRRHGQLPVSLAPETQSPEVKSPRHQPESFPNSAREDPQKSENRGSKAFGTSVSEVDDRVENRQNRNADRVASSPGISIIQQ